MMKLELLAPAKNLEIGKAAIDAGADAVYIGSPKFGARAAAGNSIEEIAELCEYAHLFGAKVFATLNTILYNEELDDARRMTFDLYHAGIDALIIQDMALLNMDLPPIPIHASTQANNRDWEKVKFLEDSGVERVILARELNINEIRQIKENTSVELEFFVHGALCVSYSGQCYMSQAICDRSANRGACSQPCRSAYNLLDKTGRTLIRKKHLLSLKDLNLSDSIADLAQAGVCSFKIEGRLKDASYVRNVVAYYRQILDKIILSDDKFTRASSGKSTYTFTPDPERSFHRGSTSYFAKSRSESMITMHTQKSLGKLVGRVKKAGNGFAYVKASESIHNNDGLCFFDSRNEIQGFKVDRVEGDKLIFQSKVQVKPGAELYRNFDHEFNKMIERPESSVRKMDAELIFRETKTGFELVAQDEDGIQVSSQIEATKEPAKNEERAKDQLLKQLSKSGDTPFVITNVKIELDQIWFLPASQLNALRRVVLQDLEQNRTDSYKRQIGRTEKKQSNFPKENLDFTGNVSNRLSRDFYKKHGVQDIEQAFELSVDYREKTVMTTRYCILFEMGKCLKQKSAKESGLELPLFLENNQKYYRLNFDCKKCEMHVINQPDVKGF